MYIFTHRLIYIGAYIYVHTYIPLYAINIHLCVTQFPREKQFFCRPPFPPLCLFIYLRPLVYIYRYIFIHPPHTLPMEGKPLSLPLSISLDLEINTNYIFFPMSRIGLFHHLSAGRKRRWPMSWREKSTRYPETYKYQKKKRKKIEKIKSETPRQKQWGARWEKQEENKVGMGRGEGEGRTDKCIPPPSPCPPPTRRTSEQRCRKGSSSRISPLFASGGCERGTGGR